MLQQFDKLAEEFNFYVVDARPEPKVIFEQLREGILRVLVRPDARRRRRWPSCRRPCPQSLQRRPPKLQRTLCGARPTPQPRLKNYARSPDTCRHAPSPGRLPRKNTPPEALERFLKRVLVEQLALCDSLAPDPVHDLRVALRRCRSLAEGFGALDDHRVWRRLHKSAKELQDDVAGLRDAQVMASRIRRLRIAGGAAGEAVAEALRRDERKAKRKAQRAVEDFPRKRWKRWRRRLLQRAEQIDAAPASFAHLVLERLREAAAQERRWRGTKSQIAAHSLRIAVKRLRYTVQSFLPEQYAAWEKDLKRMQDALGDIHDLDVLRAWLQKVAKRKSLDHQTVHLWMKRIAETRRERVERYKQAVSTRGKSAVRTSHAPALWDRWRHEIERLAEPSSPASGEASA